ncbi:DUF488 domain-containing protein [Subtercola frigoramans]|uniref:Uncharacterized protein (DUF488 family) n=1 Tax=Subtercola frigoramans TaxID=120298 RepID=A0ABS2L5V7_9MICO|nr:DUF488 domain-containing protein [Subtercola frigoramans]MBM7472481.1 uncharacterized protein (DUF488 family) [Subtercola frigoramans]
MDTNVIGIGYEGLDSDGLLARLRLRRVSTVVDVRLNPISRKRGMSKSALRELLANANIGYEHFPALGNPRDNREGFADITGQAGKDARARYEALLSSSEAKDKLDSVIALSQIGLVALLCFEADECTCHREVVLTAIRDRELTKV